MKSFLWAAILILLSIIIVGHFKENIKSLKIKQGRAFMLESSVYNCNKIRDVFEINRGE